MKEGKRFIENSADAKAVQKQYSELKNEVRTLDKQKRQKENFIAVLQKQLQDVEEKFEKEKGCFQKCLDSVDQWIYKERYITVGQL